ncbi:MAG: 4Fe-4S dicluster domain-containing protein [Desulfurococcaceae archaeon]
MSNTSTVRIYFMGKAYDVPRGLTIMKALEYIGFRLVRGVGCRGGFCGACGTIYRIPGDYKFYVGLACQTTVRDNMDLVILPYTPLVKKKYNIDNLKPDAATILSLYPEITRCVGCNSCTKVCPQSLEVMDIIQTILRGDVASAAKMSFDCISCGLCSLRCPAEIRHNQVFQLLRRIYGKYYLPKAKHVEKRIKEISDGVFEEELNKLMNTPVEVLKEIYSKRTIESE